MSKLINKGNLEKDLETIKYPLPDFNEAELLYTLTHARSAEEQSETFGKLITLIKRYEQLPLYKRVCETMKIVPKADIVSDLEKRVKEKEKYLEDMQKEATESCGETEIREAATARAMFLVRIGAPLAEVQEAIKKAVELTIASGLQIDLHFLSFRVALFFEDIAEAEKAVESAEVLIEKGADWDRRNRHKVHKAIIAMRKRDFSHAVSLLDNTLSTYAPEEIFTHAEFVAVSAYCAVAGGERKVLKEKVVQTPEFAVIGQPDTKNWIKALAGAAKAIALCDYRHVLEAILESTEAAERHWLLYKHSAFVCREARARAYSQMLDSYRSLKMEAMAKSFGVSEEFLEGELVKFIRMGKVHCKIDKVSGVVDVTRPDEKNRMYQEVVQAGDQLITRLQNLSRILVF